MKPAHASPEKLIINQLNRVPTIISIQVTKRTDDGFYLTAQNSSGDSMIIHTVVLQRAFPQNISQTIRHSKSDKDYLIITAPYISPSSAALLEQNGCGYADFSGNCLIQMDNIYISNTGHPNQYPKEDRASTIFNPSSHTTSLILRELMKDTSRKWKLKNLAETVGCSIGLASRVKEYLVQQNWASFGKDGLQITNAEDLLHKWSQSYSLPESLNCYTLDSLPVFEKNCFLAFQVKGIDNLLSGFSGGVRYTPVVRYMKAHVLVRQKDVSAFLDATGCRPVDSGSNVSILIATGEEYFFDCRTINESRIASPLQVYLDCMQLKGRGEEMAEAICRKEILK